MLSAQHIIDLLGLEPHPAEGGFFRETYRAVGEVAEQFLPPSYRGARRLSTAIYYLLTPETMSHLHRLESDEVFHHYLGDPTEQLLLYPDGASEVRNLGADLAAGQRPQALVPAGVWQGMRLSPGGTVALLGCTVAPGFEFADYTHGSRAELCRTWPDRQELIEALTTL